MKSRASNKAKVETRAGPTANMTKIPNCGNGVVIQLNDKANCSKRPFFLDRIIVETLDRETLQLAIKRT